MSGNSKRRHVFISHHHKDDATVDKLQRLIKNKGYDIRISSIRAFRPENKDRWKNREVSDETIKRLLRMRMAWAQTVVVLVGKHTHERKWVNWEIAEANRRGKRIVGVYEQGGTEADLPDNLKKYGSNCVAWNGESIITAIDGTDAPFQNPDGTSAPTPTNAPHVNC